MDILCNDGCTIEDMIRYRNAWKVKAKGACYKALAEEEFQMSLDYVGGDDSYSDWKWHVLSLGKENFERLIEGYHDAVDAMEELRPIESFNYAWPHPYDFRTD